QGVLRSAGVFEAEAGLRLGRYPRRYHDASRPVADHAAYVDQVRGSYKIGDLLALDSGLDLVVPVVSEPLDFGMFLADPVRAGRDQVHDASLAHRELRRIDALGGLPQVVVRRIRLGNHDVGEARPRDAVG